MIIRSGRLGSGRIVCRHWPPPPGSQRGRWGVVVEPAHQFPVLAPVARDEKRGGFRSRIQGAVLAGGHELPHALERLPRVLGELEQGIGRLRPRATQVVAPANGGAEERVLDTGDDATAAAPIVGECVDGGAREVRPAHLPLLPGRVRGEQEHALHGAHQEQHLALADPKFTCRWHRMPPGGVFSRNPAKVSQRRAGSLRPRPARVRRGSFAGAPHGRYSPGLGNANSTPAV